MSIPQALRALFGRDTQTQIAERLTRRGVSAEQTKVSRWLRGQTMPSLIELAAIERAYDKPAGWLLTTAGLVDVEALAGVKPVNSPGDATAAPELAARVDRLEAQLLEALTGAAGRAGQVTRFAVELEAWAARVAALEAKVGLLENQAQFGLTATQPAVDQVSDG